MKAPTTPEVIEVLSIELDLYTCGQKEYIVVANVADMVETMPERLHPAELAHPAEYGPAQCSGTLVVMDGDFDPPKDPKLLRDYIEDCDIQWVVDTYD
jgi:hypothetical protein|tara:strand:- start:10823 stop:11116 length:294 start_codon:yes stop_codon:yes gene_type:complete